MTKRKKTRITRTRTGGSGPKRPRGSHDSHWADPVTNPKDLPPPAYTTLEDVPEHILERGIAKLAWIQRFLNEGCPRGRMMQFARAYAETLPGNVEPPPDSTLRGWIHRHRHFGLLGLMDAVPEQSRRVLTTETEDEIAVLRFGAKQGPAAVLKELQDLGGESPSYSTVRRAIRKLERENPHLAVLVDQGVPGYKNTLRLALAGGRFPAGTHVAVDSTTADILIRMPDRNAPDGWIARRPALTVVEDIGSRALLSFNLSLFAVDSGIILSTFRRGVMQEATYPGLVSLPTLPRRVYVDKGAEHQGEFKAMLEKWGVEIKSGRPEEPEENARVERLIGTLTSEVFKPEPGYSKNHEVFDPYADPDKESRRRFAQLKYAPIRTEIPIKALLTLAQLEHKILSWAIGYNLRSHPGLPMDEEFMRLAAAVERIEQRREVA